MPDLVAIRDRARLAGPTGSSTTTVERVRLDDRYATSTGRVLRVLAPAGYGKSTLVARWVAKESRPVRWLDLEPIDNDPLVLASALVRGLNVLVADDGAGPQPDVATERGLAQTLGEIVVACESFVIVLDDVHNITEQRSMGLIDLIAQRLPASATLVLVGRAHHHHDAFARLRLRPGIVDVSAEDLAFDLSETEAMLTMVEMNHDFDTITALDRQFEGWPAGLRLATLVMRSAAPRADTQDLDRLGRNQYVTEYVATEWLAGLDDDRELMTAMGCLGRFSAEMCDQVLCRSGSAADIRRLVREDLVVLPLDHYDGWYRMHPVLSELLSTELHDRDPQRWHDTHLAASTWWESAHDIDLAIRHAATAGDLDRCEELVFKHGGEHTARGMATTVDRWLALLGDKRLVSSPRLTVVAAINAPQSGNGERAQQLARMLRDVGEIDDDADDLNVFANVVKLALEPIRPDAAVAVAERAVERLQPGAWRVLAGWVLGGELFLDGDDRAEAVLRDAIFEADLFDLTNQHANAQATLAVILELEGRRDDAAELGRQAHAHLGIQREEVLATSAPVSAMVALVEARAGRHDLARDAAQRARRHLTDLAGVAVWFNVLGRLALARACLLLDDTATACDLIGEVDAKLAGIGERLPVADVVDVVRAEVDAAAAVGAERTWQLTDAELRVLRYLPTNLSLANVAARLYVSRHTVKTHAAAIYRKLGASSRGEAVELAGQAGLIDNSIEPNTIEPQDDTN